MTEKVRVITESGFFDMDKPENFLLGVFVASIRSQGYLLNDRLYQPHDRIISIFIFDPDNPQGAPMQQPGTILQ